MTKRLKVLFILLLAAMMVGAQNVDYPAKKNIESGKFAAAEKEIMKHLGTKPDVLYLYAAAELYSDASYSNRDLQSAYQYICQAKDEYNSATSSERDKLLKKGMDRDALNALLQRICALAYQQAQTEDTEEAYAMFIAIYPRAVPSLLSKAQAARTNVAYRIAEERNTEGAYAFFIQQYPDATEVQKARSKRDSCAYEHAKKAHTIEAYQAFIEQYPDAEQVLEAQSIIYDLAFAKAQKEDTQEAYDMYILTYPNSPHSLSRLHTYAIDQYKALIEAGDWRAVREHIRASGDEMLSQMIGHYAVMLIAREHTCLPAAKYVWRHAPTISMRDYCWLVMHDVYCASNDISQIGNLYEYNPNPRFAELEAHDRQVIKMYMDLQHGKCRIGEFVPFAAPYTVAYHVMLTEIAPELRAHKWNEALAKVQSYAAYFSDDPTYNHLVEVLSNPSAEQVKPVALSPAINTRFEEYSPVMTADGRTLYFVSRGREENIGGEDIFVAERQADGSWGKAQIMTELNTAKGNEAMQSVSADGTKLIFFRNGTLYTTSKTANGWSEPTSLPATINISSWQSDAMISSDGKALIFSAHKQVDNESAPSVNIFVSLLDSAGEWSEPISIGPTINTPLMERKPFLHPDMRTLYFSSQGHGSIGEIDVFMTTRLRDDSWTEWSEPVNMGVYINTPDDDWGYKISTDGTTAYYSNGLDIYALELPESMRPNAVATILGNVYTDDGEPVGVTIRWEDLETHEDIGQSQTDPSDGSFYLVMPLGKNYGYYIDDSRFFPLSNNIDLIAQTQSVQIEKQIYMTSYKQMIEQGQAVQVNNLFFPVNEWELLPQSENELIRVAAILKQQNIPVELSGHTDSSGDNQTNIVLSRKRAESVRNFLISQGCNPSLLVAKGYGASQPIADNDTEEGKQQNRRVELRFIK